MVLTAFYVEPAVPSKTTVGKFPGHLRLEPSIRHGLGALVIDDFEKPMEGEYVCKKIAASPYDGRWYWKPIATFNLKLANEYQ